MNVFSMALNPAISSSTGSVQKEIPLLSCSYLKAEPSKPPREIGLVNGCHYYEEPHARETRKSISFTQLIKFTEDIYTV